MLEDPLSGYQIGCGRMGNKIPCVILQKGGEFIFHGSPPIGVGIDKSSMIASRHREQQYGMVERRLTEPELVTGDHGMLIGHWGDKNRTRRKLGAGAASGEGEDIGEVGAEASHPE